MFTKKNNLIKKNILINFIFYISTITFCSELFTVNIKFISLISYFLFAGIIIYLVDLKKFCRKNLIIFFISLTFIILSSLLVEINLSIILKYILILYTLFLSTFERKLIQKKSLKWLIYYPYLTLISIGIFQTIIIFIFPSLPINWQVFHGNIPWNQFQALKRPMGLSLEPTFYSQYILLLAIFSKEFKLDSKQNNFIKQITNLFLIILLLLCRTRTTILGGILFLLFNFKNLKNSWIFFKVMLISLFIATNEFFRKEIIQSFIGKITNLLNISGEPRERAFRYMIKKLYQIDYLGYGFNKSVHESGLMVGSLYANFPIAAIYSLGIGSLPIFYLLIRNIFQGLSSSHKLSTLVIIVYALPMPFLYTTFGLLSLFLSTSRNRVLAEE